uniref:Uncharacterized protein n=1 Tax=Zea mays TaxID=4577 RepID=C0P9W4_MAIZE|nr:unknown [Zea mays]
MSLNSSILHYPATTKTKRREYIYIRRIDRIPCLVLEETIRLKVRHNVTSHRFRRRAVADFTPDHYLTVRRRFVRIVDAGEPFDFAGACELVEAFGVPGFAHLKRHVQEHLYKRVLGQQIATRASVASVGRYEARDADEASVGEQLRYFPLRMFSARSSAPKLRSRFSPCLRLSPSRTYVRWPLPCSSRLSAHASVLFPDQVKTDRQTGIYI